MLKTIDVSFPEGSAVQAEVGNHSLVIDVPAAKGGQDSGPTPFELLMTAVATCSALHARMFCEKQGIPTTGLGLRAQCECSQNPMHIDQITLELTLPQGFPEERRQALLGAVNACGVKNNILNAPRFQTVIAEPR